MGGEPFSVYCATNERGVTVSLPADVDEWLDAKAAELGVDREAVVVQLLSSYRAAEELDDDSVTPPADVESQVRDVIAERIPDIADAVQGQVDTDTDAVEDRLTAEVDRVETDFRSKLDDVRERVVQVKRDADAKADPDHTHPELDELATLSTEVDDLTDRITDLSEAVESGERERDDLAERVEDLTELADRLDDVEDKLQTVAWVVSDLKDELDTRSGTSRAVEQLKQAAAEADVDRAVCDSCERPVDIALLSSPNCPHCEATVNDVELPGGLFGKPRLTVARQLEAGDEGPDDDLDVPDGARR
jgi:chromosome segregation ATPase